MVKLVNRAQMTITAVASSGTGALTLGAASAGGFQTFADAGVSNLDTVRYTIKGPNAGDFEIGSGVYTASGTTLSRTPTESSNSNNAITATTDSVVFVTAAAADLGPTVHSNINGLVAQTGMTVGDTALVTGTNKLFMYTASGWFLIATMTNASPSAITGAAASYSLASDGTATVITLTATDPEGFPITFSHTVSTGSLGSTATVSQGTGASANVFTITPSSNSAHAGTFSLTFSASDGSNVSQAISSFTLTFMPQMANLYGHWSMQDTNSYSGSGAGWSDLSSNSNDLTWQAATSTGAGYKSSGNISEAVWATGDDGSYLSFAQNALSSVKTFMLIMDPVGFPSAPVEMMWRFGTGSPDSVAFYFDSDTTGGPTVRVPAHTGLSANMYINGNLIATPAAARAALERDKFNSLVLRNYNISQASTLFDYPGYNGYNSNVEVKALLMWTVSLTDAELGAAHNSFTQMATWDM